MIAVVNTERQQQLRRKVHAPHAIQNAVGISAPDERRGIIVVLLDVVVNGAFQVFARALKAPGCRLWRVRLETKVSTTLSQEQDFSVKWKRKRGRRSSQSLTVRVS